LVPTPAHGKICYIEMPAKDIGVSSAFYKNVERKTVRRWPNRFRRRHRTSQRGVAAGSATSSRTGPPALHHGQQRRCHSGRCRREWRGDRSANRWRPSGDYRAVSRSRRQCHRTLSGTWIAAANRTAGVATKNPRRVAWIKKLWCRKEDSNLHSLARTWT
jgi:hypothetical protein